MSRADVGRGANQCNHLLTHTAFLVVFRADRQVYRVGRWRPIGPSDTPWI